MSTETIRLVRDGEKGRKGVWRWRKKEIICLSLHCHHQNDSCIKMGSDENHFNVSVGSDGQSHKTRRAEAVLNRSPSAYKPNDLPLGQTGSQTNFQVTGLITLKYGRVLCDWNCALVTPTHGTARWVQTFGVVRQSLRIKACPD